MTPATGPRGYRLRRNGHGRALLAVAVAAALGLVGVTGAASAGATVQFAYYGGPVMHSTHAIVVQWGSTQSAQTDASDDQSLVSYVAGQSGTTADPFASLAEYTDSGGDIAPVVSSGGTYVITPPPPPPLDVSGSVSEATVESALRSEISSGALPAPTADGLSTAYFVVFDSATTVTDAQGAPASGTPGWCTQYGDAQQSGQSPHILFALLPDPAQSRCPEDSQSVALTHVWASMLTSPLVAATPTSGAPTGWYGSAGSAADICDGDTASDGPFTVQTVWSQRLGQCVDSGAEQNLFRAPSASISVPASIAPGQTVAFTTAATSTNASDDNRFSGYDYAVPAGISSYQPTFGDSGTTASGPTVSHTFPTAGAYTVTLTVTDTLGFTQTTAAQILVQTPAPPQPAPQPQPQTPPTPTDVGGATDPGSDSTGSTGSSATGTPSPTGSSCTDGASSCPASCASTGGSCAKPRPVAAASITSVGSASLSSAGAGMGLLFTGGEAVRCPFGRTVCVVEFNVKSPTGTLFAEGTLTLGQGRSVVLRAGLTAAGQAAVAHHQVVSATLTVVVSHGSDGPVTSARAVTLSAPRHRDRGR